MMNKRPSNTKPVDVTIIFPPKWTTGVPWTAPAYIVETLRQNGYNVQFLDYNIQLHKLCSSVGYGDLWTNPHDHYAWFSGKFNFLLDLTDLEEIAGQVIGISTTATNLLFAVDLARRIRRKFPAKKNHLWRTCRS